MKKFIFLVSFLMIYSCDKESIKESSLLLDSISTTKYYPNEIFTEDNLRLYGVWQFSYIYDDAGIAGGPGKTAPTYDYLKIKEYGIYGKIKNDEIIETGMVEVVKQDNSQFEIKLIPEKIDNTMNVCWYNIHFIGNDSVKMYDARIGCGFLYNAFKKHK